MLTAAGLARLLRDTYVLAPPKQTWTAEVALLKCAILRIEQSAAHPGDVLCELTGKKRCRVRGRFTATDRLRLLLVNERRRVWKGAMPRPVVYADVGKIGERVFAAPVCLKTREW